MELLGIHTNPFILDIAFPIGISFYTFHGMSYVFDIYRGQVTPTRSVVDYALFVSFFPLLVAGPIERASHLIPQIQRIRKFDYAQAVHGSRLIIWGMFKKVFIADSLSRTVDGIFENYESQSGVMLVFGIVAFAFQIYCDFSGYSDIAMGVAKLFGFELLSNFRFPYFSRNLAEFWKRWHISLSSWFRDYLYIPLGGSKTGKTIRNTFIIFLVSGFWHGAKWNFIIWGLIHACGFLPILLLKRNKNYTGDVVAKNKNIPSFMEFLQMLGTFSFVCFAWIFFRANGLGEALGYIHQIFRDFIDHPTQFFVVDIYYNELALKSCLIIVMFIFLDWWLRNDERNLRMSKYPIMNAIIYILMFIMIVFWFGSDNNFIYFQF